jgi:hypothetical protein
MLVYKQLFTFLKVCCSIAQNAKLARKKKEKLARETVWLKLLIRAENRENQHDGEKAEDVSQLIKKVASLQKNVFQNV